MENSDPLLGQAIKAAVRRPMWPKNKIRTNPTGPDKEKEEAKASPRIKVGIMV